MADNEKEFENFVREIKFDDVPDPEQRDKLEKDLLAALANQPRQKEQPMKIWRAIMKSPITKLGSAALIITVVIVGIMHFGTSIDGTSVVWAEAVENIEQANSAIFRETRIFTCDGTEVSFLNSNAVCYYSSEYGAREDMYNIEGLLLHRIYWLTNENLRIRVVPPLKQYERTGLNEVERAFWGQPNFWAIVELLKSEMPTPLGRKVINGREAEGFEIRHSKMAAAIPIRVDSGVARSWIDIETGLPIRYEAELLSSDRYVTFLTDGKPMAIEVIGYEPQWNAEIEPNIFEPNIPTDYTRVEYGASIVQPLFEPNIPALYRDALDRFIDERGQEIQGEQILVDMMYLQTQGQPEDWLDFLEKQHIEFTVAPATDRVCYTILGAEKVTAIFEFLKSDYVLRLLARPTVIGPSGYTASVGLDGFGVDVKVEERNQQMDLSCSVSEGQQTFEVPSVRIRLGEALLIEIVETATATKQDDSSAENETKESRVLFLIKAEQVKL